MLNLSTIGFFLRFYVNMGVNLRFQFIIGFLITCWLVGLGGLSYLNETHLKKKKKKKNQAKW